MTALLGLMIVSLTLFLPVHATKCVGNDDGEFQTNNGIPSYMFVEEAFSTTMSWSSSPPSNLVSLQYNPDIDFSFFYQYNSQWFQSGIISNSNGCASFTVQIYSTIDGGLVWRADYPTSGCITVSQILAYNAIWYIQEDMSNNVIQDVYFGLTGYGGLSHTIYPPHHWIWLRSNICWCGTDGGSTTFTSAGGISYMGSNKNVVNIDPPVDISTRENSNMQYGCFRNAGTITMSQSFGLSGHC